MPLGFVRLNEKTQRPNKNINFIKPIDGPDKDVALDYLSRIAAISAPVMRDNHLSVMSLEEYEPNREFWGRNFNFGECIQLVLKSPTTGRWLPFRFVQMVFMHELAHCKEMNHGRYFWRVRNTYSDQLRELWNKNYTGDGLWGRGQALYNGQHTTDSLPAQDAEAVRNLCGGTYRRAKRKRKSKPQLSYAERKQRRIEKKFGKAGVTLGDDELQRMGLENGKIVQGKPRVAGSKRGRELRAAALLDRLEKAKTEANKQDTEESETEDDSEHDGGPWDDQAIHEGEHKVFEADGHSYVKVCDEEDQTSDGNARNELEELGILKTSDIKGVGQQEIAPTKEPRSTDYAKQRGDGSNDQETGEPDHRTENTDSLEISAAPPESRSLPECLPPIPLKSNNCIVCSLENEAHAVTCAACGNVLDIEKLPDHWRCSSTTCQGTSYVNPGDSGICGLCGASKQSSS